MAFRHPKRKKPYPASQNSGACLKEISPSSDLQASSSPAQSSNLQTSLAQSSPVFPIPGFSVLQPSSLKVRSPPEAFQSQQCHLQVLVLPIPLHQTPLCPTPLSSAALSLAAANHEPILLSCSSMKRRSLCFQGCLKNPSRHIQYLFRRKEKKPTTIVTKVAYIQTRSSPWLSTGGT